MRQNLPTVWFLWKEMREALREVWKLTEAAPGMIPQLREKRNPEQNYFAHDILYSSRYFRKIK